MLHSPTILVKKQYMKVVFFRGFYIYMKSLNNTYKYELRVVANSRISKNAPAGTLIWKTLKIVKSH